MPRRPTRPRYYPSRRAYYAQVGGKQVLLAKGERDDPAVVRKAWECFREVVPSRPRKVVGITEEESNKLLMNEEGPVSTVFYLMYLTGCRPAEACALSAANLDAHTQALRIKERLVSCKDDEILWFFKLLARIAKRNPTDALLRNSRGQRWTADAIHGAFARLRDRLGLRKELTTFSWRHTFAVRFLEKGGSITDLGKVLGISETQATRLYGP